MNSIDLYVDEMIKQAQESLELDLSNARMRSTKYGNNSSPLIDTGCLVRYEGKLLFRKYFPTREQCKKLPKFGHKKINKR